MEASSLDSVGWKIQSERALGREYCQLRESKHAGIAWSARLLWAGLSIALCVFANHAFAQQVTPPSSTDPGLLRERLSPRPDQSTTPELPALGSALPAELPEAVKAIRVTLGRIQVEGATVFTAVQLQEKTARFTGREITGSEIFGLANELTVMYRNAGYILALVIVPPQSLESGTLTLRAVEGYIAQVNVEGDPRVSNQLAAIGEKIMASRPLQASVLERYLLTANDFPGIQLRSVLAPSQTVGATDLTLIATIKQADGFASVDNYGSKYIGPEQMTAGVTLNQLFAMNDQLRVIAVGTGNDQMMFTQLAYSSILNTEGLKLGLSTSQAKTKPGDTLKQYDINGNSEAVQVSLNYPFLRTRNQRLLGKLVYDHSDVTTDTLGARTTQDKLRTVRIGLSWFALDRLDGQNTLDVDMSKGVGGTGPVDSLKSRVGADGSFTKFTFDYERNQNFGAGYGLTIGMAGQWSEEPLLSSEQFALGGRRFGRAYDGGELVGDRGLAFRVEPSYAGRSGLPGLSSYQAFGFYDVGEIWKLGTVAAGSPESQSMASAGVGVRLFMGARVMAQLEAAKPLTKSLASSTGTGRDVRLLGSVTVRF